MTKTSDSMSFEAGGQSWTVRMVPSAWIELEDDGLGNVQEVAASLQKTPSFKLLRRIMHAGLKHKHPHVTEQQVAELVDEIGSEALLGIVTGSIQNSFPKPKPAPEGNDPELATEHGAAMTAAGTGISS